MRFLADMGVAGRVVHWLLENGHDAVHLRDEGLQRLPNGQIFQKAVEEDRIILTFDLDFGEITALSKGTRCSSIVFRLRNTRTDNVIKQLRKVLDTSSAQLERGSIIVVEDFRHRIRSLMWNVME
ncbi:DUF5615 family PIN-like protein [bacterium]|nr:DUF5615 family PIN-like protein [bacterium]